MKTQKNDKVRRRKSGSKLPHSKGLVGVAVNEAGEDGHGDDAKIEEEGPVLEVVKVVLNALVNGGIAAPAVDLGPAGDADAQAMPVVVAATS